MRLLGFQNYVKEGGTELEKEVVDFFRGAVPDDHPLKHLTVETLHHPTVQADMKVIMENSYNTMYSGPTYIGTPS